VHSGLVGLGWSVREADAAVDAVATVAQEQQESGGTDVPVLLRAALRTLSRA
jgi:Holliday junction DNA helicase RuvA